MPLSQAQKTAILQHISLAIDAAGPSATNANQIDIYSSFIKIHSNFKELYEKRGILYSNEKNWDGAINDYNILIALDPNAYAYTSRGAVLHNKANEHLAKKEYDQAIDFSSKAIEDHKAALAINPNYQLAKDNLAYVYGLISFLYIHKKDNIAGYNYIQEAMKIDCNPALKEKITKEFQRIEKLYNESRVGASAANAAASTSSEVRKRIREEEEVEVTAATALPALESFSNIAASVGEEIRIKQEPAASAAAGSTNWRAAVRPRSPSAAGASSFSFAASVEEQQAAKRQRTAERE